MEQAFDLLRMVSHVIESVEERAAKILRSFKEPIVCDMLARVMPDSFGRIQFRPVGWKLEDFHVATVRLEPVSAELSFHPCFLMISRETTLFQNNGHKG
jgi:hypothetical protein